MSRNVLVIRIGKVHKFVDASPRLLDLRGRNAYLVLARKLVAETLRSFIRSQGFDASIDRCGGNAIYISFSRLREDVLNQLFDLAILVSKLFTAICRPIIVSGELYVDGKLVRRYELSPLMPSIEADLRWRAKVGDREVSTKVVCSVCGATDLGIDVYEAMDSEFVRHVLREEKSCCIRDLMLRMLGRIFTNPGIITVFTLGSDEWLDEDRYLRECSRRGDVVSIEVSASQGPFHGILRARFFRHVDVEDLLKSYPCIRDEVRKVKLGDRAVVELVVYRPIFGPKIVVRAIAIGLHPRYLKSQHMDIVTKLENLYEEHSKALTKFVAEGSYDEYSKRIDEIFEELEGVLLELAKIVLEDMSKLSGNIFEERCKISDDIRREVSSKLCCEKLFLDQVRPEKLRESIEGGSAELCVFPVTSSYNKAIHVDAELSYVNLDGSSAYDLEAIASRGASLAFIRCDGDSFGKATDPRKLIEVLETSTCLRVPSEVLSKLREKASDATYVIEWDSLVEYYLCRYLRRFVPILFRKRGVDPLTIYVGGDENLVIVSLRRELLRNFFEALKHLRNLVMSTIAIALREKLVNEGVPYLSIATVLEFLRKTRIGTLSGAVVVTKAKVPAYYIVLHVNSGVELAKKSGRDALAIYTIVSLDIEDPENVDRWLSEPIAVAIPFECDSCDRNDSKDCLENLVRAYNYVYTNPEALECVAIARSFCVHEALDHERCLNVVDEVLEPVISMRSTLRRLFECVSRTSIPRPSYATVELLKYIDRGV